MSIGRVHVRGRGYANGARAPQDTTTGKLLARTSRIRLQWCLANVLTTRVRSLPRTSIV